MRITLVVCRWIALLLICSPVWAQKPPGITEGEMALLPEFCQDAQGFKYGDAHFNPSPRAPKWVGMMGQTFWAIHHHCWALIRINRAKAIGLSKLQVESHLRNAVADFIYVLNHANRDFILLPEVLTRMGDTQVQLGDYGAAMDSYKQAREVKPDYWPAYVRWADVLVKVGKRKEAKALVEEIVRITPEDQTVLAHYRRFGGDPVTFVRSLPPRASPAPAASAAAEASATAPPAPEPAASEPATSKP